MTAGPPPGPLVVDARFRSHPSSSGVHFWTTEVLHALGAAGVVTTEMSPERGSGPLGHAWEQLVLPARYRAQRSELPLFSPCNWGPVAVADQVVVLHDVAPLVVPQHFSTGYRTLARTVLPPLARRVRTVLTVSTSGRADIVEHLGVDPAKVVAVGAGTRALPPPSTAVPLPPVYFAFVGAHDPRKNLEFLLDLWPRVHRATGAQLVVTRRPGARSHAQAVSASAPWCTEIVDPDDAVLAAVLSGAKALLWPSVYEGFGMPLLEAYQAGTGFLSGDTGVAGELALDPADVLPLDAEAWVAAVVARAGTQEDESARTARRARAATFGWDAVAGRVWGAITR